MLELFPDFLRAVLARLEQGEKQYGDTSFLKPPDKLAGEIEQELLDVCAWSFILWTRIREIKKRTESL